MQGLDEEKKRIEAYVLKVARRAGMPIPFGEIPGETPDFRYKNGELGRVALDKSEGVVKGHVT